MRTRHGAWRPALGWATGLGAALAAFWLTREEGVWILPALLAALLLALLRGAPRRARWRRTLASAGLAIAVAWAGVRVGMFQAMNWLRYGVADIVEFKQREFVAAYAAMTRITPAEPVARPVVATPGTLAHAYAVSPSAERLAAGFAAPVHANFIAHGCEVYRIVPCDGATRAAWFMWALREAAAMAGLHRDAREARAFYAQMTLELNAACDAGRIPCGPPRSGMAPPFDARLLPAKLSGAAQGLWIPASLRGIAPPREALSCYAENCAASPNTGRFLPAVHSTLFRPNPPLETVGFRRTADPGLTLDLLAFRAARAPLALMIEAYRWVLGALLAGARLALPLSLWLVWRRRMAEPLVAALVVFCRALLMGWLDAVAMPGITTLYLWPAQPPLAVFALASVLAARRLGRGSSNVA